MYSIRSRRWVLVLGLVGFGLVPCSGQALTQCGNTTPPLTLTDDYECLGGQHCFVLPAGQSVNLSGHKITCPASLICASAVSGNGGNSTVQNGTIEGLFYTGAVTNVLLAKNLRIKGGEDGLGFPNKALSGVRRAEGNVITGFHDTAIEAAFTSYADYVKNNFIEGRPGQPIIDPLYGIHVTSTATTGSPDITLNYVRGTTVTGIFAESGKMDLKGNMVDDIFSGNAWIFTGTGAITDNLCSDVSCAIPSTPFSYPDAR